MNGNRVAEPRQEYFYVQLETFKADLHIACRAHAVPMPRQYRALAMQCR